MATAITGRPNRTVEGTAISNWISAYNPIMFDFQRTDYVVDEVEQANSQVQLTIIGQDITSELTEGDSIYFTSTTQGSGVATIDIFTFAGGETLIRLNQAWTGAIVTDTGPYILNLLTKRPDYQVQIDLYNSETDALVISSLQNKPFKNGQIKWDAAPWIKGQLSNKIAATYSGVVSSESDSTFGFYLKFTGSYGGTTETEVDDSANVFQAVNTARQIQNVHGQNLGEHVAFNQNLTYKAKFMCPFKRPVRFGSYPFSLNFIFDKNETPVLTREEESFDGGGASLGTSSTTLTSFDRSSKAALCMAGSYASNAETVQVWLESDLTGASAPEAQNVTASGDPLEGETLTGSYTYFDADGDAEDVAGTELKWTSYNSLADANADTGGTDFNLGSNTYNVLAADISKYFRYKVRPHALTGDTPGNWAMSPVVGPVQAIAITGTTSKQTGFALTVAGNSTDYNFSIDWGDGTIESFNETTTSNVTKSHNYGSAGDYNWKIFVQDFATNTIRALISSNQGQKTTLDISKAVTIDYLDVGQNSGLNTITFPVSSSAVVTRIQANNCGLTTAPDLSGYADLNGLILFNNNSSMGGITLPSSGAGGVTQINLQNCGIAGTLDVSSLTGCTSFLLNTNPALTSITNPTSSANLAQYYAYDCDLTGTHSFTSFSNFRGDIRLANNSNLTSVTFPSVSGGTYSFIWLSNCGLTGTLDISGLLNLSGSLYLGNNSGLTDITFPASSGTINELFGQLCALGYIDMTTLTFSSSCFIDLDGNGMTAAEVNCILEDLDNTLPGSGTGDIEIAGTNAAPDGTSGGCDGTAAVTSLSGKGYTVTTS